MRLPRPAPPAQIRLKEYGSELLEVADNGVGMDVSGKATMSHGKGLRSIQKRVADLGGALDVQAKLGKGVKLTIAIPCDT